MTSIALVGVREVRCVDQEIANDLAKPAAVRERMTWLHVEVYRLLGAFVRLSETANRLAQQALHVDVVASKLGRASKRYQVFGNTLTGGRLLIQDFELFAKHLGRGVWSHGLEIAADDLNRIVDLVGHARSELADGCHSFGFDQSCLACLELFGHSVEGRCNRSKLSFAHGAHPTRKITRTEAPGGIREHLQRLEHRASQSNREYDRKAENQQHADRTRQQPHSCAARVAEV